MKKWLIIIGILVVVIAVILITYPTGRKHFTETSRAIVEVLSLKQGRARSIAGMVPNRAGFFIRAHGAQKIWDDFTAGDFFRELTTSAPWKEAKIDERLKAFQKDFAARNGFPLDQSTVMELAGEDIGLAILPAEDISPDTLLVVSRVGLKARLVEILTRLGDGWRDAGERVLIEEEYRGVMIVRIGPTDSFPFFIAYTLIDDYLVMVIAQSPVRTVIERVIELDREEGGRESLADSPRFTDAVRTVSLSTESFLEWYLRPSFLKDREGRRQPLLTSAPFTLTEWGGEIIKKLSAIQTGAGSFGYAGGIWSRFFLEFESETPGGAGIPSPSAPAVTFQSFVPAGALLFVALESDLSLLWEDIKTAIEVPAMGEHITPWVILRSWEQDTGVSVKGDILPALGDQFALVMERITGKEFLPMPPGAVIFRVANREKADEVMGRVAAWAALSHNFTLVKETYEDTEINTIPDLFFMQPGYALVDGYLIISSDREFLMKMIDVREGRSPGIETDPIFQKITGVVDHSSDDFIYLNGKELLQSLLNLGEWYMAYQRMTPDEPRLSEEIYQKKILPILNLCGICRAAGVGITHDRKVVRGDCFIYIQ